MDEDLSAEVICDYSSPFAVDVTTVTCTAEDFHGNAASESFVVTVTDTTPPEISGMPADMALTATSSSGAFASWTSPTASDLVDGSVAVSCSPASGALFGLGGTEVTCSAVDSHGNSSAAHFTVAVTYAWSGFLPPINTKGNSTYKLGSTVAVKFLLTGASADITDAVGGLYVTKVTNTTCPSDCEMQAISTSAATTGNLFRYDVTNEQYIFNLYTKNLSEGTWMLRIDLGDGVSRTANISIKK